MTERKVATHDAVVLGLVPKRIRHHNPARVGMTLQNREAVANIYYRSGGSGVAKSFLELKAGVGKDEDIHAPAQDLWGYSDVDGAVLTIVEKF